MKILFLFALVIASLSVSAVAHAECPLLMQKRLLLSDKAELPNSSAHSQDAVSNSLKKQNSSVNATH